MPKNNFNIINLKAIHIVIRWQISYNLKIKILFNRLLNYIYNLLKLKKIIYSNLYNFLIKTRLFFNINHNKNSNKVNLKIY